MTKLSCNKAFTSLATAVIVFCIILFQPPLSSGSNHEPQQTLVRYATIHFDPNRNQVALTHHLGDTKITSTYDKVPKFTLEPIAKLLGVSTLEQSSIVEIESHMQWDALGVHHLLTHAEANPNHQNEVVHKLAAENLRKTVIGTFDNAKIGLSKKPKNATEAFATYLDSFEKIDALAKQLSEGKIVGGDARRDGLFDIEGADGDSMLSSNESKQFDKVLHELSKFEEEHLPVLSDEFMEALMKKERRNQHLFGNYSFGMDKNRFLNDGHPYAAVRLAKAIADRFSTLSSEEKDTHLASALRAIATNRATDPSGKVLTSMNLYIVVKTLKNHLLLLTHLKIENPDDFPQSANAASLLLKRIDEVTQKNDHDQTNEELRELSTRIQEWFPSLTESNDS